MPKKKEVKEDARKKTVPAAAAAPAAEAPVEEVRVKKKEKRSQKERPHSKKKHQKVQVWKLYSVKGDKLERKNKNCPRCGPGTFLASTETRQYCGKCGWAMVQTSQAAR